jgi:hypothetical protein
MTMNTTSVSEFRTEWLPNVTDAGLRRLAELLDSASPLLIHGAFSKACAMGCLATHIAWHHPTTADLNDEAGVCWLTRVAKLNPATSSVVLAWDRGGTNDWALRAELLKACRDEQARRADADTAAEWTDAPADANPVCC